MKKIILVLLCSLLITFVHFGGVSANCAFDPNYEGDNGEITTISNALNDCFEGDSDTKVVTAADGGNRSGGDSLDVAKGFKKKIKSWTDTLASVLAVLAVGSIVYGALLLVLSRGEEDKLKKGKDVIKWGILGFLGVVFAGALVRVVISIMFSI